ncbi:hypothetical protein CE91St47_20080 [Eubacteriales bacterium]|nr:hypothetical protein CE91St47_20080 [Eubacteriales bacterium]
MIFYTGQTGLPFMELNPHSIALLRLLRKGIKSGPRGKTEAEQMPCPIYDLPCIEVAAACKEHKIRSKERPYPDRLGCAARQMKRNETLFNQVEPPSAIEGRGNMSRLMGKTVKRNTQCRRRGPGRHQSAAKTGHVGAFRVSGAFRDADRGNGPAILAAKRFHQLAKSFHMRKNGITLPQANLARRHGQKPFLLCDLSRTTDRTGGRVIAGIDP